MQSEEKETRIPLEDRGVFLFSGEVEDELCTDAVRWILEENFEARHDNLTFIVNSPGGCVYSGFAVIDAIEGSKIPVVTVGSGIIASMGLLIFIAGKKRVLTPNTMILSHQYEAYRVGKEHELVAGAKHDNLLTETVIRHYKKHTGLSMKKIREFLLPPSDVWLTAKEARGLGLCDEIKVL